MDDVVSSTTALEAGLAAPGLRAYIDCADIHALPARLGARPPFVPQVGWSESSARGERWLALGEIDSLVAPAGAGPAAALAVLERARERLKLLSGLSPEPGAIRYVGGLAFDARQAAPAGWSAGEAARFVLPRVLIRQKGERAEVTVLGTPEADARRLVARIREAAGRDDAPPMPLRVRETVPAEAPVRWAEAVRAVLEAIDRGEARKVVLSRDILLDAERAIDPWSLLRLIHGRDPHGLRFCLRFDHRAAFVGASPERLVAQCGREIACDCLAGTIARGDTPEEEARNAAALLASEKDGREHRIVREEILAAIAPHVREQYSPDAPRILSLAEVMHLWTPIRAELRPGTSLAKLVGGLHPTPAVGGSPRGHAMDLIRALERRPRGWYAGLVGWVGRDEADFAVAIRSGIVRGNRLTAYGGAGIVAGSDPHAEWDETARKAASFIHLFAERV